MSGSTLQDAHVSQLIPRANAAGSVVIGYDPTADTFIALYPSALQGQQGPEGRQGPAGPQGPQGVPGSPGTNGKTVLNGNGPPAASLGTNGDHYLDVQNKVWYGPKANGAWPAGFSIVGPQGPKGDPGTGGTAANIADGIEDGQIAVWSASQGKWVPQTGVSINADRTQTVEINANTALTFAAHNRRRIVLSAAANLTLAASEVNSGGGSGMEFVVNNHHSAINAITFGAGITVIQPATGTGSGGAVKVKPSGRIVVEVYPVGAGLTAMVGGDVA